MTFEWIPKLGYAQEVEWLKMINALLLMLVAQPLSTPSQSRYEMGLRLKQLDLAWGRTKEPSRRADAVKCVQTSVTSFFSGRTGEVCKSLDEAVSALTGTRLVAASGLTVRFQPSVVPPGGHTVLQMHWAYPPIADAKVSVQIGTYKYEIEAGKDGMHPIDLAKLSLNKPNLEQDVEIDVKVGESHRKIKLSVIKNFDNRVKACLSSTDPTAVALARLARESGNGELETDVPVSSVLTLSEGLNTKSLKLSQVRELMRCESGSTTFRIKFPEKMATKPTLIVAMHGAGGSENLFFEGYGSGMAVNLAMKRGWIFAAPRASGSSVQDIVKWLKDYRGSDVGRVFVIGHSMGGMQAIGTLKGLPRPAALGLFAPAAALSRQAVADVPVFLAVGDQEMGMLRSMAERSSSVLGPLSEFKSYPNCEHLMVVAEGLDDCFRFLDKVGSR